VNLKPPSSALLGIGVALLACSGPLVVAADSTRFERDVLPVFYHHCFGCHSEKQAKPKGKLRLDTAEGIRGSEVIVAGKPDDSELLKRVSLPHTDEDVMPPLKGGAQPLNDAERATLRQWIADGAKLDSWVKFDHRGAALPTGDAPPVRADVRQLSAEVQKRVDRSHAAKGTKLNAPASDETFLRRVYLDVTGRIPSLEESARFLDSKDADKRAKLIEELLGSEGYVSHMFNWKADLLRVNTRGLAAGQPGKLYDDWVKDTIRSRMPYDEFVRRLVTASGQLWENGAVGFYVRDLGMPLDHMSNMTRIFLGTRIECAQCHDHPLEPITQKDFYQMVAFTYGVSNLGSPGGYSNDNVKQWPEIKAKLDAMGKDESLSQAVSGTIAPMKRLTQDTDKQLLFPETYVYDAVLRGSPVEPRTLFGDDVTASESERRKVFAEWMTSPRNPRFAKNIANRLWKRVMGAGLIEPVDSLSALPDAEHAELMEFLTQTMIRLRFDERAFMAVLLNTRLYQSEAVRETPEPAAAFALRGPQLRRLSAEQIWDSHLVLLAKDIDERKSNFRLGGVLDPERLRKLTAMTADEIIAQARVDRVEHTRRREFSLRLAAQQKERAAAKARGDEKEVQRLQAAYSKENQTFLGDMKAMEAEADGEAATKETDPRWKSLPPSFVRASETPLPLPLGHFLRQFGQSDRREIDAFNRDPNTTHSLALMNGDLTTRALAPDSFLRRQLAASKASGPQRTQLIYRAILVRSAAAEELAELAELTKGSPTPEQDIIWALLNSPEFLFNK
jgi:hypothetical protein